MTYRQLRTDSVNNTSEILGQCLRAIEAGEATVEGCIARYPNNPELAQLLHARLAVQELPRPILPMSDKAAMRQQVLAKYRAQQATVKPVRRSAPRRIPRWAQFAVAFSLVAIILLSGGVGLVRASDSTVPGDELYGLKRLGEQVKLSTVAIQDRPALLYRMAQNRLNELDTLSERRHRWNDDELTDLTTSLRIAIAVQPDKARQLIDATSAVLQKAETAGTLAKGKRGEVLQALSICPLPDAKAPSCAAPISAPNVTPTRTPTEVSTVNPTPSETLVPDAAAMKPKPSETSTNTPTMTPTPSDTPTETPTMTPTPSATPVPDTPTVLPTLTATPKLSKTLSPKIVNTPTDKPTKRPTDNPALHPTYTYSPNKPSKTSPTPGVGNNNSNANGGNSIDNGKGGGNGGNNGSDNSNAGGNGNGGNSNGGGDSSNAGGNGNGGNGNGGGDSSNAGGNGNGGNGNGGGGGAGSADNGNGNGGGNGNSKK